MPESEEVLDKVRLLKGVLQWNLDKEFKSRLWKTRRDVKQTGEALVEAQRARRNVDETMRNEPELFASFNARVDALNPRIESLHTEVDAAMGRQRAFLQSIAVDELRAQKQRLETYSVQARFALAAIYDLSSTVGDATQ
jgi:ABC-type transporter Mla subunit MlaD